MAGAFRLRPHLETDEGALWSLLYEGANPVHEGSPRPCVLILPLRRGVGRIGASRPEHSRVESPKVPPRTRGGLLGLTHEFTGAAGSGSPYEIQWCFPTPAIQIQKGN